MNDDRLQSRYLPAFRRDIQNALKWSQIRFGTAAAERYAALIRQALGDLIEDPVRSGAKARPDLAFHAYVYHLRFSRDRVSGDRVHLPRHFVLYRFAEDRIGFARLLHDCRDLEQHLPSGYRR